MADVPDEDVLDMFIEESREHLEDVETNMLEIEEMGEDLDTELVNKVFRAAHSIKGSAGFLGLDNIKELAHKIENVLDLIRNGELIPDSEIVDIILDSFDYLRDMLENVMDSDEMDISAYISDLKQITTDSLDEDEKDSVDNSVTVGASEGEISFNITEFDLKNALSKGKLLYILEYDMIHDIQRKGKNPLEVLNFLEDTGIIVDVKVGLSAVGDLDDEIGSALPMYVLFASIIEEDLIGPSVGLADEKITNLPSEEVLPDKEEKSESKSKTDEKEEPAEVDKEQKSEKDQSKKSSREEKSKKKSKSKKSRRSKKKEVKLNRKTLRVPVNVLDQLMNRASEMVLARNQLLQAIEHGNLEEIDNAGQRIDQVSSELQESIMQTRMQPVSVLFNKFPRIVRDMARDLDKEINLELRGKDVEMDKTIIEGLSDPLTHLVRNSADHGIEDPDVREEKGKPREGTILMEAFHESGHVNIQIKDDGAGMDPDEIAMKAIEEGKISEDRVETLSDKEKINLIFLPGMSTTEEVTDVSGRGVGMDVVKSNLDKMGGSIEIESEKDKGTTIDMQLPLTLAIIPSLMIGVNQERFAIPQVNVNEVIHISPSEMENKIRVVGDAEVLMLRGELIPLLKLENILELEQYFYDEESGEYKKDRRESITDLRRGSPEYRNSDENPRDRRQIRKMDSLDVVITNTGAYKYGLVVDQLHDSLEIVVKPLGRHLKELDIYGGATILGDGHVALILDMAGLAQRAQLRTMEKAQEKEEVTRDREKEEEIEETEKVTLLLFQNAPEEYCALPLNTVQKVQEIESSDIEIVGGDKIIQYRGESIPIYALEEVANVGVLEEREKLIVLLFEMMDRTFGLLATPPVDTVEQAIEIDERYLNQTGIKGTAIINGNTTLIINILEIIKSIHPEWFEEWYNNQNTVEDKEESRAEKLGEKAEEEAELEAEKEETQEQEEEEQETASNSEKKASQIEGDKILFVEDSDFFRGQIKKLLENNGYEVVTGENGQEGWNYIDKSPDDIGLVLADLEMPVMDGFEMTKKIKSDSRLENIPVIALTSLAGEEDMERGERIGFEEYQIKLDKSKLLNQIEEYLTTG